MPSFCRHNRFIERCPICKGDLPVALQGETHAGRRAAPASRPRSAGEGTRERRGGERLRVRREQRAVSDGYDSPLLPGVRASEDARRLAQELAFANGRLLALAAEPPGLYGELRALARSDLGRACWGCFLLVYLSPLPEQAGEDPFASVRAALTLDAAGGGGGLPDPDELACGPRSSHESGRGAETLEAYRQWAARGGEEVFAGDAAWTPERRFQRAIERIALPGFGRAGRYELLVVLGRLGIYDLRADSLALTSARGAGGVDELTVQGAKRVFAIGDPLLLERRAGALAHAADVPVEALDLALANWAAGERATLGFPAHATVDGATLARAHDALGVTDDGSGVPGDAPGVPGDALGVPDDAAEV